MTTVEGTIATILGNSGAIERCPECSRALVNDHCVVHLDVEPERDVRVKAELEDGTTVVFGTDLVEAVSEPKNRCRGKWLKQIGKTPMPY